MGSNPEQQSATAEQRSAGRDDILGPGISAFAQLSDGSVLEGVVRDLSDGGVKIAGPTAGLATGAEIDVIFVIQGDQKVRYRGVVRHVDNTGRAYGVEFRSPPEQLDPEYQPQARPLQPPVNLIEKCPRCESAMELGYLVEHGHMSGRREVLTVPHWAPGRPVKYTVSMKGTPKPPRRMRVDTYRCSGCGYLESYAIQSAE